MTMFEKSWNILLTMHISDVFGNNIKQIKNCSKSFACLTLTLSGLSENQNIALFA